MEGRWIVANMANAAWRTAASDKSCSSIPLVNPERRCTSLQWPDCGRLHLILVQISLTNRRSTMKTNLAEEKNGSQQKWL